ncbi:PTS transporter subunit EIIC [Collinsella ihumii]|uniref:PTS transporter subunit EIIC n=1 Tax=Collinsella ihumii TaxID=1720204 RepID=UPI00082E767F|nr:PTS transporter subunit EIIC [Collinsella ihumii]
MDNATFAQECVRLVGGKENVETVTHCFTRLRFRLKDKSRADLAAAKETEGILDALEVGDQTQLIIGPQVNEVFKEVEQIVGVGVADPARVEDEAADDGESKKKGFSVGMLLDTVTGIFAPVITAITAGGMVKAALLIMGLFGLSSDSQEYYILNFIADSVFYFLPILLAFSSANKFGCNPYIAGIVGGVLLHPNWTALVNAGEPVSFFSIPVTLYNYSSSVLPIILTILFMSFVERFAEKVSPNVVKAVLQPLLTLGITAPVALIVIGPLGSWIGGIFAAILSFLDTNVPILVPTIVGAVCPLLVFAGMHLAIFPSLQTIQRAAMGYETVCGPGMLASNMAIAGATLGTALRVKNPKNREMSISTGITALCGITEPALYGVVFKFHKPLIAGMIGGAVGGLFAGIMHLKRYAFATPGIPALPTFMGDDPMNIVIAIATVAIAFAVAFIVSFILGVDEDAQAKKA